MMNSYGPQVMPQGIFGSQLGNIPGGLGGGFFGQPQVGAQLGGILEIGRASCRERV